MNTDFIELPTIYKNEKEIHYIGDINCFECNTFEGFPRQCECGSGYIHSFKYYRWCDSGEHAEFEGKCDKCRRIYYYYY